jgi:hypothetical protein
VLAAQEHAAQVGGLHALPGLQAGLEDRGVVVGGDSGVVEQHVDASQLAAHAGVQLGDRRLVGDVGGQRQLAHPVLEQVDADHPSPLAREHFRRGAPDPTGGARDDAHLPREPAHADRLRSASCLA